MFGLSRLSIALQIILEFTAQYLLDRKDQKLTGDCIIGEFLGDGEQLLIRLDSEKPDYGSVVVVNPIIARDDWFSVEANFYDLIMNYFKYKGDKYWENISQI
ncbi:hypothetical protein [Acinetobacter guillouiae]|uniref:hypothetical protein n=1 Tax=Acinetobacter guillouiae TaxID=106649 RepID=UPI001AE68080|nr:hypothetical protein [Acinetobacter guillouiae]MBP2544815.1 hypothetical protein [Acinetobacter guillouiae]